MGCFGELPLKRPAPGKLLQLKIALRPSQPPVWRRLLVSDRATLSHLLAVLQ